MAHKKDIEPINDALLEHLSILQPKQARYYRETGEEYGDLFEAICLVGTALGIQIKLPLGNPDQASPLEFLEIVAETSQCRLRLETLSGNWWEEDCGPLLAFNQQRAVVALIRKKDQYYWHDPRQKTSEPLTSFLAESLFPSAIRLYRSFPKISINWKDIFKFVFPDIKFDIKRILILQLILGLFALLIPIATGIIFDSIIPNADTKGLLQFIIILILTTFIATAYGLGQAFHLIRARFISNISIQSAVWDRLLKLPLPFFRQFTAGDLAHRVRDMGILQNHLCATLLTTLLNGVFSIFSLLLMFYYDWVLALCSAAFALLASLIVMGFGLIQLKYQRPLLAIEGKMSGLLFQLLSNISKLRVSNSEVSAFGRWSKQFSEKNTLFLKTQMNILWFRIFHPLFAVLATILIYLLAILREETLSFGHFLAFAVAFGQFLAVILNMGDVLIRSLMIVPIYERVKPILNTLPEMETEGNNPSILRGEISLHNLSFRYQANMTNTLENITLHIKPGSLVAFVGPSGAGKSTLLRLLMGFEIPNTGTIHYDGHDLSTLNIRALRKQISYLSRNSFIFPGSIYENITALSASLTVDDAWEAARQMQIADEIKAMPMDMETLISEGGKNISVGQRQRILLARAIVHKPRILLLDEATSALDNATHAKVLENLGRLNITRIVASHRLTTFKHADWIYVLSEGKIVQEGNFQTLMEQPGLFTDLVKWQLYPSF